MKISLGGPARSGFDAGSWASRRPALVMVVALFLLTVYRVAVVVASDLQLYFDEAYYWFWSNSPAYGYYSKPPMIAWVIRLTTLACGDGEACIRGGSLLLFPLTAALVYRAGVELFDARTGLWSGLLFATLPLVSFYSQLMTTDSLLLFFWSLGFYGFQRAIRENRLRDWLLTGLALGGGLLSKYTMGFFLISVATYAAWSGKARSLGRNIKACVALLLALTLFMPNLVWNGVHGFASFRHTADIAHWKGELPHPGKLLEFVGGQFLLIGPLLGLAALMLMVQHGRALITDEKLRMPVAFALPILLIYSAQALVARANINWAAAAYVPGSIVLTVFFLRYEWRRAFAAALTVNFLLGLVIYHYTDLAESFHVPLTRKTDVYAEFRGWEELASQVKHVLDRHPEAGLLCDNRRVMSELIYYLRPHPLDAAIYNPSRQVSDHFRLTADIGQSRRDSFLFVTAGADLSALRAQFGEVFDLGVVEPTGYGDYGLRYRLFLVRHFRGYAA